MSEWLSERVGERAKVAPTGIWTDGRRTTDDGRARTYIRTRAYTHLCGQRITAFSVVATGLGGVGILTGQSRVHCRLHRRLNLRINVFRSIDDAATFFAAACAAVVG